MWLFIFTAILLVVHYSPCASYRRFSSVLIHDTLGSREYFSMMLQFAENKPRTEFKNWSTEKIKETCLHVLVDGISFLVIQKDNIDRISAVRDFDRSVISTKIHETFASGNQDLVTHSIDVEANETIVLGVPAHKCAKQTNNGDQLEFAIISAQHRNLFFLLTRKSNHSKFKIIAIVESKLSFDMQSLRKKDLELMYLNGYVQSYLSNEEDKQGTEEEPDEDDEVSFEDDSFESFENEEQHVRVCDLDEFHRYRLCSTAYFAWMQFKNEVHIEVDYLIRPGNSCMKKEKILLNRKAQMKTVEADLLPCAIRGELSSPQIFVTNDKFRADSVFILEVAYENDESNFSEQFIDDEPIGYSLVLHIHNVSSLKTFDDYE